MNVHNLNNGNVKLVVISKTKRRVSERHSPFLEKNCENKNIKECIGAEMNLDEQLAF
jgi:hypothetical protein